MRSAIEPISVLVLCLVLPSCQSAGTRLDAPIAPAPAQLTGDYARLQGTWVTTYNEAKGIPLREMAGNLFIFERDRFRLGTDRGSERFAVDETTSPKRIDFDDGHSPMIRGIYQLDGDRMIICGNGPGNSRPAEFKTSMFSTAVLTKLQRRQP
jgi:uncharacterized protein (TIGR03067 family)